MAEQLKIYASLVMLLLFSTWFVFSIDPEEVKKQPVSDDSPDYYMNTFVTTSYTKTGSVKQKLSARRLAHYPFDNRSEFSSIYISTTNPDMTVWEVTADEAVAQTPAKIINLRGDINISEVSDTGSIKVQTEDLEIDYNKNLAKTEKKVIIASNDATISGEGMIFDFKEHILTLNSNVRGEYRNPDKNSDNKKNIDNIRNKNSKKNNKKKNKNKVDTL